MCPPKKTAISTIKIPYEPSRDPKVHVLATQLPLQKIMRRVCRSSLKRSLSLLKGVTEPEEKRKIIGREFIHVFQEEAEKVQAGSGHCDYLLQGTLFPM